MNIGTLFAFILVNVGVDRPAPDAARHGARFPRAALRPVFPIIGIGLCIYLMTTLEGATWIRFGAWLPLGLVIYAGYGYRNSRLRHG